MKMETTKTEQLKPFRAWVAWHPDEEQQMKCGRWENDLFFDKVCIDLSEEEIADGWRIVEVLVTPVTKLDYHGVEVELEKTPRSGK